MTSIPQAQASVKHSPDRLCNATTKAGGPCQRLAMKGETTCYVHGEHYRAHWHDTDPAPSDEVRDKRDDQRFYIDNDFVDHVLPKVRGRGAAVYMTLCRVADYKKGSLKYAVGTLAKKCKLSEPTVRAALADLADLNVIHIQARYTNRNGRRWNHVNVYTLLDRKHWRIPAEDSGKESLEGGGKESLPGGKGPLPGGEDSLPDLNSSSSNALIPDVDDDGDASRISSNHQQLDELMKENLGIQQPARGSIVERRSVADVVGWYQYTDRWDVREKIEDVTAFVISKLTADPYERPADLKAAMLEAAWATGCFDVREFWGLFAGWPGPCQFQKREGVWLVRMNSEADAERVRADTELYDAMLQAAVERGHSRPTPYEVEGLYFEGPAGV